MNIDFQTKLSHIQKLFSETLAMAKKVIPPGDTTLTKIEKSYQRAANQTFQIAVMAMAKSGKSTFLNALLGDEFLSISNKPETAVPVRIIHSNENSDGILIHNRETVARGAKDISLYIKNINERRRQSINMQETDSTVRTISNSFMQEELQLFAPIHAFKGETLEGVKFEIFDTPGFGEAGTTGQEVRSENFDRLDEIGVVLYLLDYTKLNFEEDDKVIDEIFERKKGLTDSLQKRLFFVITKIDLADSRHNDNIEKTKHSIFTKLSNKLRDLKEESIFAISADDAILARMIMNNVANENAIRDFAKRIWGLFWEDHGLDDCKEQAEPFLKKFSFLPQLERSILSTIYENREKILFDSLLEELDRYAKDIYNRLNTSEGVLLADKKKIEEIEKDIIQSKKKSKKLKDKETEHLNKTKQLIDNQLELIERDLLSFATAETKVLKKAGKQMSKEEAHQTLDEVNKAIAAVLQDHARRYINQLKERLAGLQAGLFKEFADLTKEEAANFEQVLGRKLEIDLHPGTIDMDVPSSKEILDEANKKLQKFIDAKQAQEAYEVDVSSWCNPWSEYETKYRDKDEYAFNQKEILEHWKTTIVRLNNNFSNMAQRFVVDDMQKQLQKIEKRFNEFIDQYLAIIVKEKNTLNKEGVKYYEQRLTEIHDLQVEIKLIFQGIENYKALHHDD